MLNAARMRLVDAVTELASCNVIKTRTRAVSSQDFANQPTMTRIIRCVQRVSLIEVRLVHQVALPRERLFGRFRGHSVNACPMLQKPCESDVLLERLPQRGHKCRYSEQ